MTECDSKYITDLEAGLENGPKRSDNSSVKTDKDTPKSDLPSEHQEHVLVSAKEISPERSSDIENSGGPGAEDTEGEPASRRNSNKDTQPGTPSEDLPRSEGISESTDNVPALPARNLTSTVETSASEDNSNLKSEQEQENLSNGEIALENENPAPDFKRSHQQADSSDFKANSSDTEIVKTSEQPDVSVKMEIGPSTFEDTNAKEPLMKPDSEPETRLQNGPETSSSLKDESRTSLKEENEPISKNKAETSLKEGNENRSKEQNETSFEEKTETDLNEKPENSFEEENETDSKRRRENGLKDENEAPTTSIDMDTKILHTEDKIHNGERPQTLKVYKRRWYALFVFSLYSFTQACFWNTFGPISSTSEKVFGWNDGTIALLSNWGPIAYIVCGVLFSWMLDVKGLRIACLVSCLLTLIGAVLRCITMKTPAVTGLVHFGHLLNGMGGPVAMGGPPIVSAVWFPLQERATATAIGTAMNYMGVAISFVLGPYLVQSIQVMAGPSDNSTTTSAPLLRRERSADDTHTELSVAGSGESTQSPVYGVYSAAESAEIERARDEIRWYMIYVAAYIGALFVLMLIYFPKKPPLPPAASAAIQRESFTTGLKHLFRRKMFWLVALIYGVSLGVLNSWASVLSVNISPLGISEKEAGWIGFYATVGGCAVSLILARFADIFKRVMKKLVLGLYVAALVCFIVFALASIRVIPSPTAIFYVVIIAGTTSLNASVPLIFEMACELSYPTGEGTTNIVLTVICNIGGLLFLFVGMIPNIGTIWMNWTLIGSTGICLPMWLLMKERYNRLAVDEINPTLDVINTEIFIKPDRKDLKTEL